MKVKRGIITPEAFSFEICHQASHGEDIDKVNERIKQMQFREISFVIPPYLFDRLIKARREYMVNDEDEIILTALDGWLEERKAIIDGMAK
jgi:phage head maturation protease